MSVSVPTPDELVSLLAHILGRVAGGTEGDWLRAIGEVEKLPTWANVRSNWAIHPTGTADEIAAIGKAAEVMRAAHPYVAP